MPKLRVLSGDEVIAILKANGFERDRQSGSHVIMRKQLEVGHISIPFPFIIRSKLVLLAVLSASQVYPALFLSPNYQSALLLPTIAVTAFHLSR